MSKFSATKFFNANITVTDGGFFKAGSDLDWSTGTHCAPSCKFYYITDGECEITIKDRVYIARAGDWFFIPARVPHGYHNFKGKPFKKYWMHFDIYPARDIVSLLGIDYLIHLDDTKMADELFSRFKELYSSEDFADGLSVKAIVFELLALFIRLSVKAGEVVRVESASEFSDVFSYIENNMSIKISNKTLADISHMHPTHFIRCFKRETGQTPMDYINQRKLERAKNLLESTELEISEISERLGFYDAMHFSKSFKNRYSLSPSSYRKNTSRYRIKHDDKSN